jgi:CubicO group peptidase (beta-lactamase class C family)
MKTFVRLSLLFSILFCAPTSHCQTITRLDGSKIAATQLDSAINILMENAHVTGLAVSVFNNNWAVYQRTFGYRQAEKKLPLTDSTNMYGASLSKAVFGVLVMKLVEEGIVDLDRPLQSYLPKPIYEYEPQARWHDDFTDLAEDSLYHYITARMCLAHTSGFPNWRWYQPDKKLKVLDTPGSRYRYSGEGMVYLQVVLEKLTGRSLEDLAQTYVFKPLDMAGSSYTWQPRFANNFAYGHAATGAVIDKDTDNEARSASTLETTPADYTKFLEAVLQQKIISPASYQELFTPAIKIRALKQFGPLSLVDSTLNDSINLGYALGWGYFETPYGPALFKEGNGSGFQHYTAIFPKTGQGIMILSNSNNTQGIYGALMDFGIKNTFSPLLWNDYLPYTEKEPLPAQAYGYVCPPCNKACDATTFTVFGQCPHCGMQLQPKIDFMPQD